MGTKGVQLIPFFADHFVNVLEHHEMLNKEIDVNRFNLSDPIVLNSPVA
jgi:hypothetical protein